VIWLRFSFHSLFGFSQGRLPVFLGGFDRSRVRPALVESAKYTKAVCFSIPLFNPSVTLCSPKDLTIPQRLSRAAELSFASNLKTRVGPESSQGTEVIGKGPPCDDFRLQCKKF
jgi:hypothetical protein